MALQAEKRRQRATTISGRTWIYIGTILVVMGTVAMAAELVLQQQLHRSNCDESIFQLFNVKTGVWCGIPIIFYGLLTVSIGLSQKKTLMIMLALLSVMFTLLASTLLITEVNFASIYNHNISLKERRTEVKAEQQLITAQRGEPILRFSSSDKTIRVEGSIVMAEHGTKSEGHSSTMNRPNEQDPYIGYRSNGTEDEHMDRILNGRPGEGKVLELEVKPVSPADVLSSAEVSWNTTTTTRETEEEDSSDDDSSGLGERGLNDDDEDRIWEVEEEQREEEEYVSGLKGLEEMKTEEVFLDLYKNEIVGMRKKRDLKNDCCPEEEKITLQWLIQLMRCLMVMVGFVVLFLSIVIATLVFAPCCCYQKDVMNNAQKSIQIQSVTSAAATGKDDDTSQWSEDTSLLQV